MQCLRRMKRDMVCEDIRIQLKVKLLNPSLCLVFHHEKLRPSLPSNPSPTDCTKDFFWIHYVITVSLLIIWDPPYNVMFAYSLRHSWGQRNYLKPKRIALPKVDFKKGYYHLGKKWSSQMHSVCLPIKTSPNTGHMLCPLTEPLCMREEHLGHFSLEH